MNQIRNFVLGSAGALGLMEISNSEVLLEANSDPESMAIKAVVSLLAGALTSLLSRFIRRKPSYQHGGSDSSRSGKRRQRTGTKKAKGAKTNRRHKER